MSTVTNYYNQAEFALAAYANLHAGIAGTVYENALDNDAVGMSPAQGSKFAENWLVADQFTDASGASATVFQGRDAQGNPMGQKYLAIRGTEATGSDLTADGLLALGLPASFNPQFVALKGKIDAWLANGTLGTGFTVAGHSLGGYLAAAVKQQYSAQVTDAYLFNAPGEGGPLGNLANLLTSVLGLSGTPSGNIWNIRGSEGFPAISGLGYQLGTAISIQTEAASNVFANHSIVRLTDALAIQALYATLAPSLTQSELNALVDASGNPMNQTFESALDALRTLLSGPSAAGTPTDDRNGFYENLYALQGSTAYKALVSAASTKVTVLAGIPSTDIVALAARDDANGIAARYALKALNPFALVGADYTVINSDGALDLYNPAGGRPAGMTSEYLVDRAAFLERKLWFSTEDQNPLAPNATYDPGKPVTFANDPDSTDYRDLASGYEIRQGPVFASTRVYAFGSDKTDILTGQSLEDHLYGDAGTDFLTGGAGDDYLEGGSGLDIYQYDASRGFLNSPTNDGNDTIRDTDGKGVLRYTFTDGNAAPQSSVIAEASVKLSDTQWQSADGKFTYTKQGADLLVTIIGDADGTLTLRDFRDGDFGIRLLAARTTPTGLPVILGDQNSDKADILYGARPDAEVPASTPGEKIDAGDDNDIVYADRNAGETSPSAFGNADWVLGGAGRDQIEAGAGNDLVEAGSDGVASGDAGGDIVDAGTGDDEVYGGQKVALSDAIMETGDLNHATGQKGDFLSGGDGEDWLIGERGNDLIMGGRGRDLIVGGAGDDNIYGDWGRTAQTLAWSATRTTPVVDGVQLYVLQIGGSANVAEGLGEADTIYAGSGADWVFAGAGDDFVDAGKGDDVVFGGAGADILIGGDGADVLVGDSGVGVNTADDAGDYLDGGAGNDLLFGNGGDDVLIGGPGKDILIGGAGKDIYIFNRGDAYEEENIVDVPESSNAADASVIVLGAGITRGEIKFRPGSLLIDIGNATDPDAPHDRIHIEGFNSQDPLSTPVIDAIQFADGSMMTYQDVLAQGFDIDGTAGSEVVLYGTAVTDRIDAKGGNDVVSALSGDDTITGGTGNDVLYGGAGADTYVFNLGDGDDIVSDTDGANVVRFGPGISAADLSVLHYTGLNPLNQFAPFMQVSYGAGGDRIRIENGLLGHVVRYEFADGSTLSHAELMQRSVAPVSVSGTQADENLAGSNFDDYISADAGNDTVLGQGGADIIYGGDGNDTLAGGTGNDTLYGGAGDDAYTLSAGDGTDVVHDDEGANRIVFGDGIAASDLSLNQFVGDDGLDDLTVTYSGGSIEIANAVPGGAVDDFLLVDQFDPNDAASQDSDCLRGDVGDGILAGGPKGKFCDR